MIDKDLLLPTEIHARTIKWNKVLLSDINSGIDYLINILNQEKWDELKTDRVFNETLQIMNKKYKNEVISSILKDSCLDKKVGGILNGLFDIIIDSDITLREAFRTNKTIATEFVKHVILIDEYKNLKEYGLVLRYIIDYSDISEKWINRLLEKDICAKYIYFDLDTMIRDTPDILVEFEKLGRKLGEYFTKDKIKTVPNYLIQLVKLIDSNKLNYLNCKNLPMVTMTEEIYLGESNKAILIIDTNAIVSGYIVKTYYTDCINICREPVILGKSGDFILESKDRGLKVEPFLKKYFDNYIYNPSSSPYTNLLTKSVLAVYNEDRFKLKSNSYSGQKVYYLKLE